MITQFKIFETHDPIPENGDYVYCEEKFIPDLRLFLSKNIGKVFVDLDDISNPYHVKYYKIPAQIKKNYFNKYGIRGFVRDEILFFSKDIEDLKIKINSSKFGI